VNRKLDIEEKIELITRFPTEEVVTIEDLKELLTQNESPKHYIGIEMSGPLHIGSLLINGYKINDFIKAGLNCTVYLADWHSYINNKLDGDWEKIIKLSKYYEKAFKFFCPGVNIVHGSDLYKNNDEYWRNIVKFSRNITITRNVRCLTILGRNEKEALDFAQYLYPPMQAVDIYTMNINIAHAGMDQRKIHMLAREVFPKLKWKKPIAIHHHLLAGLTKPEGTENSSNNKIASKMSKSKGNSAIFIHDDEKTIKNKINNAYCPQNIVDNNPILDIIKTIIFHEKKEFIIERPSKYGGNLEFNNYNDLEQSYINNNIHPLDLKNSVSTLLNELINPIREQFKNDKELFKILGHI